MKRTPLRKKPARIVPRNAAKRPKLASKPLSISKLIKEADRLFSLKVRMRGAWLKDGEYWNRCYTSGYEAPVKKLHCGHYLSRYFKAARWHEDNARPQSIMANMWMKGDLVRYRQNLVKEIGEARVLAVEALRDATIKLTREYLTSLIEELKKEIRKYEK